MRKKIMFMVVGAALVKVVSAGLVEDSIGWIKDTAGDWRISGAVGVIAFFGILAFLKKRAKSDGIVSSHLKDTGYGVSRSIRKKSGRESRLKRGVFGFFGRRIRAHGRNAKRLYRAMKDAKIEKKEMGVNQVLEHHEKQLGILEQNLMEQEEELEESMEDESKVRARLVFWRVEIEEKIKELTMGIGELTRALESGLVIENDESRERMLEKVRAMRDRYPALQDRRAAIVGKLREADKKLLGEIRVKVEKDKRSALVEKQKRVDRLNRFKDLEIVLKKAEDELSSLKKAGLDTPNFRKAIAEKEDEIKRVQKELEDLREAINTDAKEIEEFGEMIELEEDLLDRLAAEETLLYELEIMDERIAEETDPEKIAYLENDKAANIEALKTSTIANDIERLREFGLKTEHLEEKERRLDEINRRLSERIGEDIEDVERVEEAVTA